MSDVGERIVKFCNQQGITEGQLAERSNVSVSTIQGIVKGKTKNTRIGTVQKICKGLGVTLAVFFE